MNLTQSSSTHSAITTTSTEIITIDVTLVTLSKTQSQFDYEGGNCTHVNGKYIDSGINLWVFDPYNPVCQRDLSIGMQVVVIVKEPSMQDALVPSFQSLGSLLFQEAQKHQKYDDPSNIGEVKVEGYFTSYNGPVNGSVVIEYNESGREIKRMDMNDPNGDSVREELARITKELKEQEAMQSL
ncbi:hypothetical protein DFA_12192 [Cavenderia fasciculata]|uniref:Uncharacterized protein n=1 Tax=Cavenderia fasciculata TaxID=261658 RepID=F4QCJ2_CACFS|nr:uncharacterized protein DFA_12192 [Cavenderia fasciculata]EGG14420.1 hypothetical protein DFA_12192 [Cavenderia fasciculata]|eukprot:XP_004353829.1 hypothetical protein DFA_12192 [Cavenderia fasciculata]